jgi:uncharacterized membrane protein
MSEKDTLDLLLAVYANPDLAHRDYGIFVKLAENKTISTGGIMLVSKDTSGVVHVEETKDHAVRNGVKRGARAGLIAGLFAPLFLGATVAGGAAVGGLAGEIARRRVTAGIGGKLGDALPAGLAGVVAIYDHEDADAAMSALTNAVRTSSAPMDQASPTKLKAGLQEARAGLMG